MKDWTGNRKAAWATLGASNHAEGERAEHDYYATDPKAARLLMEVETFSRNIWECACGEGHLAKEFEKAGYTVKATDLIDRGYGIGGVDFFSEFDEWHGDIITNPPYKFAKEFVEHALEIIPKGFKVAMFLKVQFLEGKSRRALFEQYPPKVVYVSSSRLLCAKNGQFESSVSSSVAYAWFVWQKGYKGYTVIKWIN